MPRSWIQIPCPRSGLNEQIAGYQDAPILGDKNRCCFTCIFFTLIQSFDAVSAGDAGCQTDTYQPGLDPRQFNEWRPAANRRSRNLTRRTETKAYQTLTVRAVIPTIVSLHILSIQKTIMEWIWMNYVYYTLYLYTIYMYMYTIYIWLYMYTIYTCVYIYNMIWYDMIWYNVYISYLIYM